MSTDPVPPRPFFVIGTARSGTTLLQTMLAQAPGVTLPNETKFMTLVVQREDELGPIESEGGWAAAVRTVLARNRDGEFPVPEDALRDRLMAPGPRSHRRLLLDWLSLCAEAENATIVGEKTPEHTRPALRLAEMFPEAKFVLILRDPRDVVLSQMKAFPGRSLIFSAIRWRTDQESWMAETAPQLGPDRALVLRYEDLVQDPEVPLRAAAEFLGIPYTEAMLDPSQRRAKGFSEQEAHKLRTLEKVTSARIGQYRKGLSAREISMVQAICAPQMRALGYPLEPGSHIAGLIRVALALPGAYLARRRMRGNLRRRMSEASAA